MADPSTSTSLPESAPSRWAWRRLGLAYAGIVICIWAESARIAGGSLIVLAVGSSVLPWRGGRIWRYPTGLGWRGVGPAFYNAQALLIGSAALLIYGWLCLTPGVHPALLPRLGVYLLWALLQQVFLQTFTQNSLRAIDDHVRFTVTLTGLFFCLVHIPNLPLVLTSLPVILYMNFLFRRSPSIYPLVIAHALLGVFLDDVLDISLKIGPGYLGG